MIIPCVANIARLNREFLSGKICKPLREEE